jgi:lysyl-tRNA synthetase class 1
MVTAVQIARDDEDLLLKVLERSGYETSRRDEILARARNVRIWLERYAPPFVKFDVKEDLPQAVRNISPEERRGLGMLAERIEGKSAQEIHDEIYAVANELGLDPKKFFQAVYLAFLGERQGPKAGWFIASLDRDFVKRRLIEASVA